MREEIFGPILPVLTYRTLDDVVERINARGTPLALYVFSRRQETVRRVLRETSSGGAAVNDVVIHLANPNIPFGGVGESGQGSYHGWYGFRAFSHERSVLRQGRASLASAFHPPYGARTRRLLAIVGRLFG
jgi:aldehyde dehydrogenase (NAD+)